MRFLVLVPANADSEAGTLPDERDIAEMGKFNEELIKAGVMLAGDGLHPSSKGARVTFDGTKRPSVVDGPFTESKELVAGFWIWQVKSKDEAVEWLRRAPFAKIHNHPVTVELRQIFEPEDFATALRKKR